MFILNILGQIAVVILIAVLLADTFNMFSKGTTT